MEYPVRIVATGRFKEDDIYLQKVSLPPLPNDVVEKVEEVWTQELERNPNLTAGPLLVARSIQHEKGKLRLECGLSDYKNFMGTTHETVAPFIAEEHHHRAVGFLAVTLTADRCFLLGVRSPKIDWGLLRHVVPAGRLRPDDIHPFTGIRNEFAQELGLADQDIADKNNEEKDLICIGVLADETWGRLNYEFCFLAKTNLSSREVIKKAKTAKSADEHCQLEPFSWQETCIRELLFAEPDSFVPTGWAGVVQCFRSDMALPFPDWTPAHRTYAEHMGRRLEMLQKAT